MNKSHNPLKNITHLNSINMSKKKNPATPTAGENINQHELSSMLVGTQNGAAHWHVLKKLNIILPYSPVVTFLGIYSIELKTYIHTKICTQILIATLFIITKN